MRGAEPVGMAGSPTGPITPAARRLDLATRWVLRAGAVALPLAIWPFGFDVFVLPKLAVLRLLVLALVALRLARWTVARRSAGGGTPLDPALALFVGTAALSTAFAVNLDVAIFGAYYRYEGLLTIVCYALLFWLSAQAIDGREAWALVRSLLAGGYLVALLAVAQCAIGGAAVGGAAGESARTFAGSLRATSTLGNADALGTFLAMLLPLATHELLRARGAGERLLAANVTAVLGLALLLTYSRAAWAGAALGVVLVAARPVATAVRGRPAVAAAVALPVAALLGGSAAAGVAPRWVASVLGRAATFADPLQGSAATRLHIWHDSIALVAARPWTGWGPDTFGLVYPRFATGDWTPGFTIDKAHNDLLQVAATQGLPGLAAHLGLLALVAVAFWRGRAIPGSVAMLAAWLAYEVSLQAGFSWLPAAAPAWLLLAAAIAVWRRPQAPLRPPPPAPLRSPPAPRPRPVRAMAGVAAVAVLLTGIGLAALPVAADTEFRAGLAAEGRGERAVALRDLETARRLAPGEAVYAAEAGDVLLDLDQTGVPGQRADPAAARDAYLDAMRLGDARPGVSRNLAAAERLLARAGRAESVVLRVSTRPQAFTMSR